MKTKNREVVTDLQLDMQHNEINICLAASVCQKV